LVSDGGREYKFRIREIRMLKRIYGSAGEERTETT
jgi:hypothetical protein